MRKNILLTLSLTLICSGLFAQNYVLDFDGDNHVLIDSTFSFNNLTQMTYPFWVKSNWQGANYLVDITDDPAGYANPNGGFRTFIGRFQGNFIFSQYFRGTNTSNVLDIDSKAGEYVHVACVIRRVANNGATFTYEMTTYLNGVEQDQDELTVQGRTQAESFLRLEPMGPKVLGARFNLRNNNFLTGQMDDFAVYDVALNESAIKDIACTGVTPVTNRTILYYAFNEGSGFGSGDSSQNSYHGQNNQPFFMQENLPNLSLVNPTADFDATAFQNSFWSRLENLSINQDQSIWDFGDGSKDTNNNNVLFHQFPRSDTFNVCLDVSAACGSDDQFCQDVIINCPAPVADFNFIYQDLSFAGEADTTNVDSVFWDFGDGNTSNSATVLHNFRFDGKKTICLYLYNNCGVDSICKTFDAVFQSVVESRASDAFAIVASPEKKEIQISHDLSISDFSYRVIDQKGSLINSGKVVGKNSKKLNLSSAGIYLVEVESDNYFSRSKIALY